MQIPMTRAGPPAPENKINHNEDDDDVARPQAWSDQEIVLLHWRLLQEVQRLADPAAPLQEKLDTLHWVFTEPEKASCPFSFVSCLRVVGCSPLSPIAYCGLVDAEEVRDRIRFGIKAWLLASLARYPEWVRQAVHAYPAWVEAQLARNPQWINEQVRLQSIRESSRESDEETRQGELFAARHGPGLCLTGTPSIHPSRSSTPC